MGLLKKKMKMCEKLKEWWQFVEDLWTGNYKNEINILDWYVQSNIKYDPNIRSNSSMGWPY